MMVMRMNFQMFGELGYPLGEYRHLHFYRASISLMDFIIRDDSCFFLFFQDKTPYFRSISPNYNTGSKSLHKNL